MSIYSMFRSSLSELKEIKCITVTGMLIALSVVIESFSIVLGTGLKINFAFLPLAAIGMLYGPMIGLISGFICDIAGFIIKPSGAFNPAFSLVIMLEGMIYGLFLYKIKFGKSFFKEWNISKIFILIKIIAARLTVNIFCYIGLNTYFIYIFGFMPKGIALDTFITTRTAKNLILLPIESIMLIAVLIPISIAYNNIMNTNRKSINKEIE